MGTIEDKLSNMSSDDKYCGKKQIRKHGEGTEHDEKVLLVQRGSG